MKWLLKLRDWVEGPHTPSREARWRASVERVRQPYTGQWCPCGAPATGVYQVLIGEREGTYYTCAQHMRITRWIPNPEDPGRWF